MASYTLASAIRKIGSFDLIFCGMESIDSNTAQIGPEIAATLGISDVSAAIGLSYEKEGYVQVERQFGDDREVLDMKLPGVITCGRIGMKVSPTQVRQVRPVVPPKKENLRIEGKPAAEAVEELFGAMRKLNLV